MQASEEILKKYNVKDEEFLRLKANPNETFKLQLLSDEIGKSKNPKTGQEEDVIWYHFQDNKRKLYKYSVPILNKEKTDVHYLVKKLGVLPPMSVVKLTYVPNEVGYGGFVDVEVVNPEQTPKVETPKIETPKVEPVQTEPRVQTKPVEEETPTTIDELYEEYNGDF